MRPCAGALAATIFALAPAGAFAKDAELLSLDMQHFRDTASFADDPAAGLTTISTERGFVEHSGPMSMVWHDEYLTALIDDRTGGKSFRIDVSITYNGARRSYTGANLDAMTGPKAVMPTLVTTETANCALGDSIYTDHLRIPVDEALLRRLAAGYAPGKAALLPFRLIARAGPDYRGQLSNAEIAGLLAKVDGQSLESSAAGSETPVTLRRLDFGISGIAVSSAAGMADRAGILVISVNGGSVAQQAGLITGDIVYQMDGHPTRSLADLEAAITGSAPHSTATIRIFRGLKDMPLKAQF